MSLCLTAALFVHPGHWSFCLKLLPPFVYFFSVFSFYFSPYFQCNNSILVLQSNVSFVIMNEDCWFESVCRQVNWGGGDAGSPRDRKTRIPSQLCDLCLKALAMSLESLLRLITLGCWAGGTGSSVERDIMAVLSPGACTVGD